AFLPPAEPHAVRCGRTRGALAGDGAFLPAAGGAGTALLCRATADLGLPAHLERRAAGAGGPCPRHTARTSRRKRGRRMRPVAIVGAGFGGLALAIRLQSAGVPTVLFEARDRPG